jgi:hypothetical protein
MTDALLCFGQETPSAVKAGLMLARRLRERLFSG